MRRTGWMLLSAAAAALLAGCAPKAALQFAPYDRSAAPAGNMLRAEFTECYSAVQGMDLRVVCRQQTVRTKDPVTGEPLAAPYTEEVLGGLAIDLRPGEDWQGRRLISKARFQYVNTADGGWVCGTDQGHVEFGGVVFGKLGIQFGLQCDRIGPPTPDAGWAYREVSGLLTPEMNAEKVAALWPKIFHEGR